MKPSRVIVAGALAGLTLGLAACSGGADGTSSAGSTVAVTTSTAPSFEPKSVDPITTTTLESPIEDPGLGVTWELQGTTWGLAGGSVLTIKITNNNDVALPVDAFSPPTLVNGPGEEVSLGDAAAAGISGEDGLDLPLGAHATTNLRYVFDTPTGNLYNSRLTIGNVTFEGNLNR